MEQFEKCPVTVNQIFEGLKFIQSRSDNPFEIEAVNGRFNEIYDLLTSSDIDEANRRYELLCELVIEAERNTFTIGFTAAKQLLR